MSSLTVRLFGPPRIELDGTALDLGHRKPLALMIYLLVTAAPHSREALAAFFWPDYPNARNYLRNNLSIIRHALGDHYDEWISIDRRTVAWRNFEHTQLDTADFEHSLAAFRTHDHTNERLCPACVEHLVQAVSLASDDFLAGFTLRDSPPFDEWSYFHRERLQAEVSTALDALVRHHRSTGDLASAIDFARSRLSQDEYHEPAHRQLMELYALNGQNTLALRQYETVEALLRSELNVPPAEETKALAEAIRQRHYPPDNDALSPQGHVPRSPATETVEALPAERTAPSRTNLPAPLNPLIGRVQEVADISAMLADPDVRLITLSGPGGVGKTRLSQAVAEAALPDYADGVYFVRLARLRSPDLMPTAIAQAAGIHVSPQRPIIETLAIVIGARQMLLVLDNFEHLLGAAHFVSDLLQACPSLTILATSREVLSLTGEYVFVVPPLTMPPAEETVPFEVLSATDAVQLFAQRARQADRRFVLDEDATKLTAHICRRLDGLPLAIELAAKRTNHLDLQTLAIQLNGYDDTFYEHGTALDILTGAKRDAPKRHRSLRRAIGWSYDLLSTEERRLFRHLSVFVGGWTLEAAQAVCAEGNRFDIQEGLASLLDKHLISLAIDGLHGSRYAMLETLREFGLEQLRLADDEHAVRAVMARYYVETLEKLETKSLDRHYAEANVVVQQELPNIYAVLDWALFRHKVEVCLRLCTTMQMFWPHHSPEVDRILRDTLKIAEGTPPSVLYASVLVSAGYYAAIRGRFDEAESQFAQGLAMNESLDEKMTPLFISIAYGPAASCLFYRGRTEDAIARLRQGIAAVKATGDLFALAMNETDLGSKMTLCGRFDEAAALIAQALQRLRTTGQAFGLAKALRDQGYLYLRLGRYADSERALTESLTLAERSDLEGSVAGAKEYLGLLAIEQGDHTQAATLLLDVVTRRHRQGSFHHMVEVIEMVAALASCTGQPMDSLRLAGAATAQRTARGYVIAPIPDAEVARSIDAARALLNKAPSDRAWAEGEAMSLDDAVSLAVQVCERVLAQEQAHAIA